MIKSEQLGYYIEDLWSKGFKLTDEDIRFIYFGKKYTNASEWKTIISIEVTLQLKFTLDGSFFLSLLELLNKESITNKKEVKKLLRQKGLFA